MKKEHEILNIVAFAILMENGKGIEDKSPEYIMEKFQRFCQSDQPEHPWGLDGTNRDKLMKWAIRWFGGGKQA